MWRHKLLANLSLRDRAIRTIMRRAYTDDNNVTLRAILVTFYNTMMKASYVEA
jgi:hypothetical protein